MSSFNKQEIFSNIDFNSRSHFLLGKIQRQQFLGVENISYLTWFCYTHMDLMVKVFCDIKTHRRAREGYKVQGQGLKVTGHQVQIGYKRV